MQQSTECEIICIILKKVNNKIVTVSLEVAGVSSLKPPIAVLLLSKRRRVHIYKHMNEVTPSKRT